MIFPPSPFTFFNIVVIGTLNDKLRSAALDACHLPEEAIRISNMKVLYVVMRHLSERMIEIGDFIWLYLDTPEERIVLGE
jgi:hypothetical protein